MKSRINQIQRNGGEEKEVRVRGKKNTANVKRKGMSQVQFTQ